ncbi:MAG: hypothetical protein AAB653_03780 [Patescibacteria group bacterium]
MNKYIKNNQGTALLMTLMILSSVLVVTLGAANLIMAGIIASRLEQSSVISYFATETGIERSLWEVRKNNYVLPDVSADNIFGLSDLDNGSTYQVDYASSSPTITFTSTGSYNESKRSIQITIAQ